ncbi:MAG: hypothetical protein K6A42_09790 [Treponema sp.]|nr:hypothetical protein [Treponema sp.]
MKRINFILKLSFVGLLTISVVFIKNWDFIKKNPIKQIHSAYHYDTFNVFHWKDIRFTDAEPNKNFIKTKYILNNPKKFNAFIFGSSRVQRLPPNVLPNKNNGKSLSWYNMTSSASIPNNHLLTIKTFLENKVSIEMIVLAFDSLSMYSAPENFKYDLMRCPYQVITKDPFKYLMAYLNIDTDESIKKAIDTYNKDEHLEKTKLFYEYGGNNYSPDLTEDIDLKRYEIEHNGYSQKDSYKDLEDIVDLCNQNKIKLILITNPMYQILYRNSVEDGYLDFLRKVAQKCEFYNFSTLNNYTTDPRYFFEWSHYRSALGIIIEKYLFGSEEEREQIRRDAGDELFGAKVNAQNVDTIIAGLKKQL